MSTPPLITGTAPTLGVDVGGSGIKGAPVDLRDGTTTASRLRLETPQPATPAAVAAAVGEIAKNFRDATGDGPIGCTLPGVVKGGVMMSAANIDATWVGVDSAELFSNATGRPVVVLNDAQAAVLGEIHYGAGENNQGLVLMLTFGTGIGSGLAYQGVAIPAIEFGHLRMHGEDAEDIAAAQVKEHLDLSWKKWATRVQDYLEHVECMIWPDLIIVGGGVSEKADKWVPLLTTRAPIVAARLGNKAGIVGAAVAAALHGQGVALA